MIITLSSLSDDLPFFWSYSEKISFVYFINFTAERQYSPSKNINCNTNLQFQLLISLLIHQEALNNTLSKGVLKILYKIFKVDLVTKIKASRVKPVGIYIMPKHQCTQSSGDSVLACQMMIIIEVVD